MDVSIIVTAFNYACFIDECLDSCLDQQGTTLEYEVIVVDDGSTDATPDLLARRLNSRMRVLRIQNSGIEQAANNGFELAKGRYIVRVDADDTLSPNYLAHMAPMIEQGLEFCYSDYTVIDVNSLEQEVVCLPDFNTEEVMSRGDFLATGTLYLAELLHSHGGYSTQIKNSGLENYELIIKLLAAGVKGVHIPIPLFKYRRHLINMSSTRLNEIIDHGQDLFVRNGLGTYRTNQYHPYKLVLPSNFT